MLKGGLLCREEVLCAVLERRAFQESSVPNPRGDPMVQLERRPLVPNTRGGHLFRTREEPSILSPGGGPLNRDVEDPEGSPIVLSQSNPISRGGPLFRHQEEALCADFERRVSVPSARGRPLSRGRKEALVSSPRGSCLCRAWDEAGSLRRASKEALYLYAERMSSIYVEPESRPSVSSLRAGPRAERSLWLRRAQEEALCAEPKRWPSVPSQRGNSLY